jgi:hypothetical protein
MWWYEAELNEDNSGEPREGYACGLFGSPVRKILVPRIAS